MKEGQFGRSFDLDSLRSLLDRPEGSWWRDLLRLWRPAGVAIDPANPDDLGVRLAVRNGYLNFYRQGQSVGKVGFDRTRQPQVKLHIKYALKTREEGYVSLGSAGWRQERAELAAFQPSTTVAGWVRNAAEHGDPEKRFVDQLVGLDENVVDLEIGLPANREIPAGQRVAQRIDLAALEAHDEGHRLVFWEIKLQRDSRLVAKGKPHIVEQMQNYRAFLRTNKVSILSAYVEACRQFIGLAEQAVAADNMVHLSSAVRRVAEGARLVLDVEPRLLIDTSDGARRLDVWQRHLNRLRSEYGLQVWEMETPARLPA